MIYETRCNNSIKLKESHGIIIKNLINDQNKIMIKKNISCGGKILTMKDIILKLDNSIQEFIKFEETSRMDFTQNSTSSQ